MSIEWGSQGLEPGRADRMPGPIIPGEEREIVAGAEQFLREMAAGPRDFLVADPLAYELREAPPGLIRRFLLQPPAPGRDGGSWIPWRDLGDNFPRVAAAAACRRRLMQENRFDHTTGTGTLTAEVVWQTLEARRAAEIALHGSEVEFDLHDVFLCAEAELLELQDRIRRASQDPISAAGRPSPGVQREALRWVATELGDLLGAIGQALG